jgi:hypothetical protein
VGSAESKDVTGRVLNVRGSISVAEPWRLGPEGDKGDRWDPAELGAVVRDPVGKVEGSGRSAARCSKRLARRMTYALTRSRSPLTAASLTLPRSGLAIAGSG